MPRYTEAWWLDAQGTGDVEARAPVWVRQASIAGLSLAVHEYNGADGSPLTPEQELVIQTRWRADIQSRSAWVDPLGRVWRTTGYAESGRGQRRVLTVSLARFSGGGVPGSLFVPPPGWLWTRRDTTPDVPVEELVVVNWWQANLNPSGTGLQFIRASSAQSRREGFITFVPQTTTGGTVVYGTPNGVWNVPTSGLYWPATIAGLDCIVGLCAPRGLSAEQARTLGGDFETAAVWPPSSIQTFGRRGLALEVYVPGYDTTRPPQNEDYLLWAFDAAARASGDVDDRDPRFANPVVRIKGAA